MTINVEAIQLDGAMPTGTVSMEGHTMTIGRSGEAHMDPIHISCSCYFTSWKTESGFEPYLDSTHRELFEAAERRARELYALAWGRDC